MFAFEHYDIEPDIVCVGKGLGAGIMPIAGMIARDDYNIAADVSLGHYTHEKSPLGCVAATAMLEYMEQHNILQKVNDDAAFMRSALNDMKEKYSIIGDVRGIGLLWGIELVKDRNTKEKAIEESEFILYDCLSNGLSFKISQGNVLQLSPPLVITRDQLQQALNIVEAAVAKVSAIAQ